MAVHRLGSRGLFNKRAGLGNAFRRGKGNFKLSRMLTRKQKDYVLKSLKPFMKGRGVTVRSGSMGHASELEKALGKMKMDKNDPISWREAKMIERELKGMQAKMEASGRREEQQNTRELLKHIRESGSSVGFDPEATGQRRQQPSLRQTSPTGSNQLGKTMRRGSAGIRSHVPTPAQRQPTRSQSAVMASTAAAPVTQRPEPKYRIGGFGAEPTPQAEAENGGETVENETAALTREQEQLPSGQQFVVEVDSSGVALESALTMDEFPEAELSRRDPRF